MAEEYCGVNWWESSTTNRSRFDGGGGGGGGGGGSSSSSTTTTLANSGGGGPGYGWLADGLGLSSQAMAEWNQEQQTHHAILNPEKVDNGFRSMLQEGMGLNTNFQPDPTGGGGGGGGPGVIFGGNNSPQIHQWRPEKLFPNNEESNPEFKQMNRGFSLDNQHQFSPSTGSSIESTVTCQGLTTPSNFQLDCSSTNSVFGSPSSILQGLLGTEQQQRHAQPQPQPQPPQQFGANNYHQQNYFGLGVSNDHHNHHQQQQHESQLPSSWAKVPQFLRDSSPKQHQQQQQQQLHFINNGPYWSGSTPLNEVRPNFFSPLQAAQLPNMPTFEAKPKTTMEVRNTSSMVKKSGPENNSKRSRNDGTSSTLPPFKVRKEKMGDRITALQQLVSPFGKTDTASVLSEAIEYIKFLHEQVSVLSDPYLKSGGSYQQNQPGNEKAKIDPDGPKQDLRSRGLCLVPVSSTFPVTHETTVDFWTPTFGGTFR